MGAFATRDEKPLATAAFFRVCRPILVDRLTQERDFYYAFLGQTIDLFQEIRQWPVAFQSAGIRVQPGSRASKYAVEALARRGGHKAEKLCARLTAMIATGAMRIGGELWAAEGAREKPEVLVKRTFAAIRAILD